MAGEAQQNPTTYNDISSGKVVNKEGLLELCGQIKTAIASAGGGSGSSGSNWTVLEPMTNIYSESFQSNQTTLNNRLLDFISGYRTDTYYSDSLFQQKVVCRNGNSIIFYIEFLPCNMQQSNPQKKVGLICSQIVWNGSLDNNIRQTYYGYIWTAGSDHYVSWYNEYYPSADLPAMSATISNDLRTNKVGCLEVYKASAYTEPIVRWRTKADFKNDLGIPSLPTDPSSDGDYVLQNTISSGTSTLSWGTPSSGGGGGTTYTAGTGISITNGVISLDLANASQEEM